MIERTYIPKALIKTGYSCNNDCAMCHSAPLREHPDLPGETIVEKARAAKTLGAQMAVLSGGEPSIRPDIKDIAREISSLGMSLGVITNGRMFNYEKFTASLTDLGLKYAFVSLHGDTRELHEKHVRTDSFDQTARAIRNLAAAGVELTVNTVITRWNVARLDEISKVVSLLGPARHKLSLCEPKGSFIGASAELMLPPPEAAAAFNSLKSKLAPAEQAGKILALCDGFTPCLIPSFNESDDSLITHNIYWMSETFESEFHPVDHGARAKPIQCFDCSRFEQCPGVYSWYIEKYAAAYLKPLSSPIANCIPFIPAKSTSSRACITGAKQIPDINASPPETFLFVQRTGRDIAAYRTPSADFPHDAIYEVRASSRHVILTASPERAEAAVTETQQALEPCATCSQCPARRVCPQVYEHSPAAGGEEPFTKLLSSLRGATLDAGPGELHFAATFARLLDGNLITYTAADPDPAVAANPIFKHNRAAFINSPLEELPATAGPFDNILLIGSLNHIPSINRAAAAIRSLLAPGGSLIVADTALAALVTETENLRAAADGPGFQHLRNFTSASAAAWLAAHGFDAEALIPEAPGRAAWALRAKISAA